jgi:hypothetical protein
VNANPANAYRHPVQLRGVYASKDDARRARPSILQMREQDFIQRLLHDLATPEGRRRLQADVAATRSASGRLRLYQPVHRISHVVLLDVSCALPGEPRLDPGRIIEAGVVVRRLANGAGQQGWMKRSGEILGWRGVSDTGEIRDISYDPDPVLRRARRLGRNAVVLKKLRSTDPPQADWQEDYTTLFKAPPDVCRAAGRTFLYGMAPLSSTEYAEGSESIQPPPFSKADIRRRIPALLKAGGSERPALPAVGLTLTRQSRGSASAKTFFAVLDYLARETGLFTDAPGTEQLRQTLESIPLAGIFPDELYARILQEHLSPKKFLTREQQSAEIPAFKIRPEQSLGGFLRQAFEILDGQPEEAGAPSAALPTSITLPKAWPYIPRDAVKGGLAEVLFPVSENMIVDAIYTAMAARWNTLQQVQGRFEQTDAAYVMRAFIRLQDTPACPVRTLWTEPSEPFEIVPWYESSGQPPIKVELPAIDRNLLSKLKPNVAFKVPASVQKFMDNINLGDLTDGKKPAEGGLDFGMICGFNIPIITLCAFIVLSIFLALLNIVFWWLPFVKICIPFPKKGD